MRRMMLVIAMCCAVLGTSAADVGETGKALVDARAKIGAMIENPAEMTATIKSLSAEDQCKLLAEVNAAIAKMPGSGEERAAKFLNVDRAALKAAAKGNVGDLLATVFATVPPEHLTVLCEQFAQNLVNRAADPRQVYTDAQYTEIATDLMKKIVTRTAETENGAARSAFAIVMLVKAANSPVEGLVEKLVETLPADMQGSAGNEWLPAALGTGGVKQDYDPLLAAADAGSRPDFEFTLTIAGPQYLDSVLADLTGKNLDPKSMVNTHTPVVDAVINPLNFQIPQLGGDVRQSAVFVPQKGGNIEPGPYDGQSTWRRW